MRRGSPAVVIASVLVALAAVSATVARGGAASAATSTGALLLRLSDLPRGYRVGDDSGCFGGVEGAPERLAQIILTHRPESCGIEFEFRRRYDPLVENDTFVFKTEEGAGLAFADRAELFRWVTGITETVEAVEAGIGSEARLITTPDALVAGRGGRPGAAIFWRQGTALSLVLAAGPGLSRATRMARSLARTQARRIAAPTPLRPRDNDDREVALDDPRLGVPVYWLGRRFDPPGPLPPLRLGGAEGPIRGDEGPGNRAMIDYEATGRRVAGVPLSIWRPARWERFLRSKLGRQVWRPRCGRAERIALKGGQLWLHSGYAPRRPPRPPPVEIVPAARPAARGCPRRAFDHFLAQVHLKGAVVTINMPACLRCAVGGTGPRDPYNSRRGLETIARALHLRSASR